MDINELMRRLDLNDPEQRAALDQLQHTLQNGAGRRMVQAISSENAQRIERAAQAAQRGDKRAAQAAVSEILSTPDGAALAAQLNRLLGK